MSQKNPEEAFTQYQFYPFFEHLWRYYLPHQLWPLADWFGRSLQQRLIWGRLYLTGNKSADYSLLLNDQDELELNLIKEGGEVLDVDLALKELKQVLTGSGFLIPPGALIRHATSSH